MKFALNDIQAMLQDQAGRLLADHGSHERLQAIVDGASAADEGLWDALRDMGLAGLLLPEAVGGVGLGLVEAALISEMIGRHAMPTPLFGHWAATSILASAQDERIAALLPAMASGERLCTVAFGEAENRWLPSEWQCVLAGDRLTGTKLFVPGAAEAGLVLVGVAGGAMALVDLAAPGVTIEAMDGVDRTRPMSRIRFEEAAAIALDGAAAQRAFDATLILLAADAFGGASRAIDLTVDYLKTREQFGTVIGRFQAVKHQIANVATQIEPCRALYWYAAYAFDHVPTEASAMAALAKAHISDRFLQAARDCVELHGGIGYTWEYDLHIWLKRAMVDFAWAGAPDVHRLRYADATGW